jgi:hypothetical protein
MESMVSRFREEILAPAQTLAARREDGDPAKNPRGAPGAPDRGGNWERELREAFSNYASRDRRVARSRGRGGDPEVRRAAALEAVEAMLTSGTKTLLEKIAEKHHVELLALNGKNAQPIWSSGADDLRRPTQVPRALAGIRRRRRRTSPTASNRITDKEAERIAAVLISDGQHNEGSSPLAAAKMLGNRQIPIYSVGVGSTALPDDLALLQVKTPTAVFYKDRVKGEVVIKDDMPPGRPFTVKVECAARWCGRSGSRPSRPTSARCRSTSRSRR